MLADLNENEESRALKILRAYDITKRVKLPNEDMKNPAEGK